MEGIVLVEMSSGVLHYTKSFSGAFEVRHPKTERLNFGALIFALQNFAGSSIRSMKNSDGPEAAKGLKTSDVAEIVMFTTPLENMVLATTPSSKLLVVLFTTPDFDVDVAKWLARDVAYKYDNCDSAEMQLKTTLNQVPRQFRHAFSQAVDEAVERELIGLCKRILIPKKGEKHSSADSFGDREVFLSFYYSPRLGDFGSDNGSGSKTPREDECRNAVRADYPRMSKKLSIRNIMASTRAIVGATPIKRDLNMKKKSEKKTRWRSKNAVIDHSVPHEFQRVIEIHSREGKAALMDPHRTEKVGGIADVLLPFVEVSSSQSLFASDLAQLQHFKMTQQRLQKLDQIIWTNIPVSLSAKEKQQAGTNVVAWRSGPCIIFYPITPICMNPENKSCVRLAVTALFDVIEPLLKAKTKILV
ncbi:hypothetical protein JG688_00008333 [Phytophthora aleatoria]|uniref:Uncharacterized protein n=1 Tax=Phytophthora aleatoria TaxID=2496075 RepID=A0A8J5IYK8_9STRA|nr:hypothetical protein JG688_00008333 [Phytophthora aleatoria]